MLVSASAGIVKTALAFVAKSAVVPAVITVGVTDGTRVVTVSPCIAVVGLDGSSLAVAVTAVTGLIMAAVAVVTDGVNVVVLADVADACVTGTPVVATSAASAQQRTPTRVKSARAQSGGSAALLLPPAATYMPAPQASCVHTRFLSRAHPVSLTTSLSSSSTEQSRAPSASQVLLATPCVAQPEQPVLRTTLAPHRLRYAVGVNRDGSQPRCLQESADRGRARAVVVVSVVVAVVAVTVVVVAVPVVVVVAVAVVALVVFVVAAFVLGAVVVAVVVNIIEDVDVNVVGFSMLVAAVAVVVEGTAGATGVPKTMSSRTSADN